MHDLTIKFESLYQSNNDGVGKNIATLQKRQVIVYEVLNSGQLKKYLDAKW
jgi:hypothetical protein